MLRGIAAIVRESHAFTIRFDRPRGNQERRDRTSGSCRSCDCPTEELAHNLIWPASSVDQVPSIAHVTLFGTSVRSLIRVASSRPFDRARNMYWAVREVCVTRELVYPSIEVEVLLRSALA